MRPDPKNYSIFPSVIKADTLSYMTVVPNERGFVFTDGDVYDVTVISVSIDDPNYYAPTMHKHLSAEAKDGALCFEYLFEGEGEHIIILSKNEKPVQEFNVYSVYEDLFSLTPLKGDLHAHSYRSDGKRDPSALAGHYREQGYDFFSLTDHNRYYPGEEVDETYSGVNTGLLRVIGEEVHTPGSVVHIVHVCGEKSVTDLYVHDLEGYEKDIAEYIKKVPASIPEKYCSRYAKAMWTTDKIHEAGGIAIFPHPYWRPGKSRSYNVTDEFARILLKSGMFDAFEIVGAMEWDGINRALALWSELRSEGYDIGVVGSSDTHGLKDSRTFSSCYNVCFAQSNSIDGIRDAVKNKNCVAVEATDTSTGTQYRAYGSLRLVSYAQFLLKYYFPTRHRLCHGEGVDMRAYAMGDASRELVELSAKLAKDFSLRYFGKVAPKLPSDEIRDFKARRDGVQANGPKRPGSTLDFNYPME